MTDVLHVVFAGHLDHGKSTLLGAVACGLRTHGVSAQEALAFEADQLEEERRGKLTIESTQVQIDRSEGRLVLIDVPGHEEFLHNMLTGATRADAVVLAVAADDGVLDQTRRHAALCSLLGIPTVVAVTKMDLVEFSHAEFAKRCADVAHALSRTGTGAEVMIPVCAETGTNVVARTDATPWYEGPALVEALGGLRRMEGEQAVDARFLVQDVYERDGGRIAAGRVVAGRISAGEELAVHPNGVSARVEGICRFPYDPSPAEAGECVALRLADTDVTRGHVLAGGSVPWSGRRLRAPVFWLADVALCVGDSVVWRSGTQKVAARIAQVTDRLATGTLKRLADGEELRQFEMGTVTVQTGAPVVVDPYRRCPALGRFVIERGSTAVGAGIIEDGWATVTEGQE